MKQLCLVFCSIKSFGFLFITHPPPFLFPLLLMLSLNVPMLLLCWSEFSSTFLTVVVEVFLVHVLQMELKGGGK